MDEVLSLRQVGLMLGVGRQGILREIRAGRLRPLPRRGPGRSHRIERREVARWLMSRGVDLRLIRQSMNPGGVLVLVATRPELHAALATRLPTRGCSSLFQLGRVVATTRCWGVVVDLPAVGSRDAAVALAGYATEGDRPELIGLVGEDCDTALAGTLAGVFDSLVPLAASTHEQGRAVLRLCPNRAGRTPP